MDAGQRAVMITRDDRAAAAREIEAFIIKNPEIFGGADIYCLDFGAHSLRAGMIAAVLIGLADQKGRRAVRRFVIVAPPGTDAAAWFDTAWAQYADTFRVLAGRELQQREADVLRSWIEIVVTADRRHSSVLDIIAHENERTAIIVADAANYRDDRVKAYIAPGAETPLRPEDLWVPQLHALATAATVLARERAVYVALDTGKLSPHRNALQDLLLSIDGCGVMGSSSDESAEAILAQHVDQWHAWIREGRLGQALNGVDALPAQFNLNKTYLRIQLLYWAGHAEQALQAIRNELDGGRDPDASVRVKLARVAQDANASALASELLTPAIKALDSQEDLESAMQTARDADLPELEDQAARKLDALFPGSPGLQQRRLRKLLSSRDYTGAANFTPRHYR